MAPLLVRRTWDRQVQLGMEPQGADCRGPQGADRRGPQGADHRGPQGADRRGRRGAGLQRAADCRGL